MLKPSQNSPKWMAALLITLSLLLRALSPPYTTVTGKSGQHTAKIRSIASIFFFFPISFLSISGRCEAVCHSANSLQPLAQGEVQNCRVSTTKVPDRALAAKTSLSTRLGQERWQHPAQGDRALPLPGWLCCSQHWYRKHAFKGKNTNNFAIVVSTYVLSLPWKVFYIFKKTSHS